MNLTMLGLLTMKTNPNVLCMFVWQQSKNNLKKVGTISGAHERAVLQCYVLPSCLENTLQWENLMGIRNHQIKLPLDSRCYKSLLRFSVHQNLINLFIDCLSAQH